MMKKRRRRRKKRQTGFHLFSEMLYMMALHHYAHTTVRPVLISAGCLCTIRGVGSRLVACAVAALLATSSSLVFVAPRGNLKHPHATLSFIHLRVFVCYASVKQRVYLLAKLARCCHSSANVSYTSSPTLFVLMPDIKC